MIFIMKKLFWILSYFVLTIGISNAQEKVWQKADGYQIRQIVSTNNKVFYCAYDDGTLFVTTGNQNSALALGDFSEINMMTVFGNNVVFVGRKEEESNLWITDGTVAGTKIIANTTNLFYSSIAVFNNNVYFTRGSSIYYLDPTQTTAQLLFTIAQDPSNTIDILYLRTLGNKLIYFYNGKLGVTDGSSSDIKFLSGVDHASIISEVFNNKLFFVNGTDDTGYELWSTDGTDANTALFKDINVGVSNGFNYGQGSFTTSNGKLYFVANKGTGNSVWVTDGTLNGTSELNMGASYYDPEFLKSIDGNIYFRDDSGNGFYFSDGLNNTVQKIGDSENLIYAYGFIKFNGSVYFVAHDPDHGYELWKTGNTASSITRVTDICPGACDAFNSYTGLTVCGNILFFSASDFSLFSSSGTPYQLWKLEGSSAPTSIKSAVVENVNYYPNPCKEYVFVEFQQPVINVQLFSVLGNELKANWKQDKNNLQVQTQDLTPGMYVLLINGVDSVNIIKE